jgi:hypothetical protein
MKGPWEQEDVKSNVVLPKHWQKGGDYSEVIIILCEDSWSHVNIKDR